MTLCTEFCKDFIISDTDFRVYHSCLAEFFTILHSLLYLCLDSVYAGYKCLVNVLCYEACFLIVIWYIFVVFVPPCICPQTRPLVLRSVQRD